MLIINTPLLHAGFIFIPVHTISKIPLNMRVQRMNGYGYLGKLDPTSINGFEPCRPEDYNKDYLPTGN